MVSTTEITMLAAQPVTRMVIRCSESRGGYRGRRCAASSPVHVKFRMSLAPLSLHGSIVFLEPFAPSLQRTGANVEARLLLLTHAFETLGMQKIVFKTETLNNQSRTAILALCAR